MAGVDPPRDQATRTVRPASHASPANGGGFGVKPSRSMRRGRPADAGDPVDLAELRVRARQLYRDSASDGTPVTGKQLAAACGMSPRWARARIAEARHGPTETPANPAGLAAV